MGKIKELYHTCIDYIQVIEAGLVLELAVSKEEAHSMLYDAFDSRIIDLYNNRFSLDIENCATVSEVLEFLENNKYYEKDLSS